jgi:hypothetical protein
MIRLLGLLLHNDICQQYWQDRIEKYCFFNNLVSLRKKLSCCPSNFTYLRI